MPAVAGTHRQKALRTRGHRLPWIEPSISGARMSPPLAGPPGRRRYSTPMATVSPLAGPLSAAELELIDAYWRAANYLSVGQIYLMDNPLLTEPLAPDHVKPRLL